MKTFYKSEHKQVVEAKIINGFYVRHALCDFKRIAEKDLPNPQNKVYIAILVTVSHCPPTRTNVGEGGHFGTIWVFDPSTMDFIDAAFFRRLPSDLALHRITHEVTHTPNCPPSKVDNASEVLRDLKNMLRETL